MRFCIFAATVLAVAPQALAKTCGTDAILDSLRKVSYDASQMEPATEADNDSIAKDTPVYKDYQVLLNHFENDLQDCEVVVDSHEKQQAVCDEYKEFAVNQKESVDVTLDDSFMKKNGDQPLAGEVHEYTTKFEKALTEYTERIKKGVPDCADQIDEAYGPVQEDMAAILAIYPAA
ncbi:hypothetical protein BDV59DRAFT_205527 [Aspergillus ambiguus]|uniref:uncharacterized protein n=1 Tax=Aspergillus ambiguus TaxID=176160 RepID=UPI003CCD7BF3